jgi:hypothetical protein
MTTDDLRYLITIAVALGCITSAGVRWTKIARERTTLRIHNARLLDACDYALLECDRIGLKMPTQVENALRKAMEEPR